MLTGKMVAAIAAGSITALAGTGFGLAMAKSKTGSAVHHTAMHHAAMHPAMHAAGAAMHDAPTAAASTTG